MYAGGYTLPASHRRGARASSGNYNGGFTLLEVLVLAMMLSTTFGALRLGVRSWESGVARASET